MLNNAVKLELKNPATGIIQRSNPKSYFLRFHQNSILADEVFKEKPEHKKKAISIIQIMLINDNFILAEVVCTDDL